MVVFCILRRRTAVRKEAHRLNVTDISVDGLGVAVQVLMKSYPKYTLHYCTSGSRRSSPFLLTYLLTYVFGDWVAWLLNQIFHEFFTNLVLEST
jgi:hypothetical protein